MKKKTRSTYLWNLCFLQTMKAQVKKFREFNWIFSSLQQWFTNTHRPVWFGNLIGESGPSWIHHCVREFLLLHICTKFCNIQLFHNEVNIEIETAILKRMTSPWVVQHCSKCYEYLVGSIRSQLLIAFKILFNIIYKEDNIEQGLVGDRNILRWVTD